MKIYIVEERNEEPDGLDTCEMYYCSTPEKANEFALNHIDDRNVFGRKFPWWVVIFTQEMDAYVGSDIEFVIAYDWDKQPFYDWNLDLKVVK